MTEINPLAAMSTDELEATSNAAALVLMSLESVKKDNILTEDEKVGAVFCARDLISSYLEVHMKIDRDVSESTATSLLIGFLAAEVEK